MRIKCKYITMSGKCLKHSTPLVNEYCVESPCEDYEGYGTDEAPTIDAEPVRHGKWKIKAINTFELSYGTTGYEPVYQCSECGGVEESYLRLDEPIMPEDADFPRYCPNCGAKMDGETT